MKRKDAVINFFYKRPELSLSISFVFLILIGAMLLMLPFAAREKISFVDALFTAVSATCVTGLVVKDTAGFFSVFGQLVILSLIQIGAIGIMTFAASLSITLGRGVASRQAAAIRDVLDQQSLEEMKGLLSFIFKMTLFFEGLGAFILSAYWMVKGIPWWKAVYWGVFHSVSAFCNAGFSLFSDSFMRWRSDWVIVMAICSLIIIGGLGFFVVRDIVQFISRKSKRLSLQTKVVVITSAALLIIGVGGLLLLEHQGMFSNMPWQERISVAVFHSVNARTAGFNNIAIGSFSNASLFLLIILMYIGASSGSTGGGIKTNTFAVLLKAAWAYFRGEEDVVFMHRTVPKMVVEKAVSILFFSITIICAAVLFLFFFEPAMTMRDLLFEAVSAFGTVGLSTGITSKLCANAKIVIIILMYVGRVGPLTLALALTKRMRQIHRTYASGKVMVG